MLTEAQAVQRYLDNPHGPFEEPEVAELADRLCRRPTPENDAIEHRLLKAEQAVEQREKRCEKR